MDLQGIWHGKTENRAVPRLTEHGEPCGVSRKCPSLGPSPTHWPPQGWGPGVLSKITMGDSQVQLGISTTRKEPPLIQKIIEAYFKWIYFWFWDLLVWDILNMFKMFLKFIFNYSWYSILNYFQLYNIVITHLHNLCSDQCSKFGSHLTPYIVVMTLLSIFPMLYTLHPMTAFVTDNVCFLISSPYFTHPPGPLSSSNHQFVLCIYESVSILFVHLYCFLDSTYKEKSYGICLSLSDLFYLVK